MTTTQIVMIVAIVAVIALLVVRVVGGPRVTMIDRTTTSEKDQQGGKDE